MNASTEAIAAMWAAPGLIAGVVAWFRRRSPRSLVKDGSL